MLLNELNNAFAAQKEDEEVQLKIVTDIQLRHAQRQNSLKERALGVNMLRSDSLNKRIDSNFSSRSQLQLMASKNFSEEYEFKQKLIRDNQLKAEKIEMQSELEHHR